MRKHRPDYWIFLLALGLIVVGTIVIFAVGPRVAETKGISSNYYILHHLPMIIAALFLMVMMACDWQELVAKFTRKFFRRTVSIPKNEVILAWAAPKLLVIACVLCAAIAILGAMGVEQLVDCNLGACRSFKLFGFGFQAVEMLKFAIMLYVANIISKRHKEGTYGKAELWVPVIAIVIFTLVFVCVGQKDLGSTVVIIFMLGLMLFASGIKWKAIIISFIVLALVAVPLIALFPHRIKRLLGFGENYHVYNSVVGIGTGGVFGVGLGNSVQAAGYLPETLTDSIFSVICESWGLLGGTLVMLLFVLLLSRILRVARHTEDMAMRMMVIAVFAWILAHVIMNTCGMIGLIPMKGITLSFLSYGGTSLVFTGAAVGIVLYISGWTRREEVINEDSSSRRGEWRPRNAGDRRRSRDLEEAPSYQDRILD